MFDTINNQWTDLPSMPTPRDCLSVSIVGDARIIAAGGYHTSGPLNTVDILDMATLQWKTIPNMNIARHYFGSATIGHSMNTYHMIVAGGMGIKSICEVYNSQSRQWSFLPQLNSYSDWRQLIALQLQQKNPTSSMDNGDDDDNEKKKENEILLIAGGDQFLEKLDIVW